MDILKRNLGFLLFLLISMVMAGFILVSSRKYAVEAREKNEVFMGHRNYFERLSRSSPGVSEENLEQANKNLEIAKQELERLQAALAERSRLEVSTMTSVQAKNHLNMQARRLAAMMAEHNIGLADNARFFSFQEVIQASGLPEQNREVPALVRQVEVIGRIAEKIAESGVRELTALNRPAGIREIRADDYTVMRFHLEVKGSLSSIKQLVNSLHADSMYYFSIPYFQFETEGASRDTAGRTTRTRDQTRPAAARPRRDMPPDFRDDFDPRFDFDTRGRTDRRDDFQRPPSRDERRIPLRDIVTVHIPVHFIEFKTEREI